MGLATGGSSQESLQKLSLDLSHFPPQPLSPLLSLLFINSEINSVPTDIPLWLP